MPRAVVFAYHNVGVRCLRVLLAHGFEIPLVVTHADSPGETIWFGSVAATAEEYGIPTAIEAIKLGATYYLTKPTDADSVLAAFGHEDGDDGVPIDA